MTYEQMITLGIGFGGVLLGGVLTFFTEMYFRRQEEKKRVRKHVVIATAEIARVLSDSTTIFKSLTQSLTEELPNMLWQECRGAVCVATQPSAVTIEILLSLNSGGHLYYGEAELLLRRFNNNLGSYMRYNSFREEVSSKVTTEALALNNDLAKININIGDNAILQSIYRTENLLRDLLGYLIQDISSIRELLIKVDSLWKDVYSKSGESLISMPMEASIPDYLINIPDFNLQDLPPFQPADR